MLGGPQSGAARTPATPSATFARVRQAMTSGICRRPGCGRRARAPGLPSGRQVGRGAARLSRWDRSRASGSSAEAQRAAAAPFHAQFPRSVLLSHLRSHRTAIAVRSEGCRSRSAPPQPSGWSPAATGISSAGRETPTGHCPVDERNPVILANDSAMDNRSGEYRAPRQQRRPPLAGIIVSPSAYSPTSPVELSPIGISWSGRRW